MTAKGDKLVVNAPKGVLTPEVRSRIAEQKVALLALLSARPGSADASEIGEKEELTAFRPGETPEPFDILPTDTSGGFPPSSRMGVPASLETALPDTIQVWSYVSSAGRHRKPCGVYLEPSAKTALAALISRSW